MSELRESEKSLKASGRTHPAILALVVLGILAWAWGIWWLAKNIERWQRGLWLLMLGFFGALLAVPLALRKQFRKPVSPPNAPCPACGESLIGHSDLVERAGRCPHCAVMLDEGRPQHQSPALLNLDAFRSKARAFRDRRDGEGRLIANWLIAVVSSLVLVLCLMPLLPRSGIAQFGFADALLLIPAGLMVGMFLHLRRRFGLLPATERCPSCRGWLLIEKPGASHSRFSAVATGCCPHCRAALFPHALPLPTNGPLSLYDFKARRKTLAQAENPWWSVALIGMVLGLAVGVYGSAATKGSPNAEAELTPYVISMVGLMYVPFLLPLLASRWKARALGLRCPSCQGSLCTPHVLLFGECPRCRTPVLHA